MNKELHNKLTNVFYIAYYAMTFIVAFGFIAFTRFFWSLEAISNPSIPGNVAILIQKYIGVWTTVSYLWFAIFLMMTFDKLFSRRKQDG